MIFPVFSFNPLLEIPLPGGDRYLQEDFAGQQGVLGTQCLCGPVLLQIRLLRRLTGGTEYFDMFSNTVVHQFSRKICHLKIFYQIEIVCLKLP